MPSPRSSATRLADERPLNRTNSFSWVLYHIQLIGGAAQLGGSFHDSNPEIRWAQTVAMRNVLVHEYFGVDLEEV